MTWTPKTEYPLAENTISRSDVDRLCEWLGSDRPHGADPIPVPSLTQGKLVRELEGAFAAKVGAKHAVCVNSGSSAALLAWFLPIATDWFLKFADRDFLPNGEPDRVEKRRVVVPAISWSTALMPATILGYEPVPCEVDEATWGLDPVNLRRLCEGEKGPPSIVVVGHVLGVPAKTKEIEKLRKEFGFLVIEDVRDAFGSQPVGKIPGALSVYSTRAGNQLSTIEGGFVCTDEDVDANILRMLRDHGRATNCDPATQERLAKVWETETFWQKHASYVAGFNARATEIQAHLGLSGLKRADEVAAARRVNHGFYVTRFSASKAFRIQSEANAEIASLSFGVLASSRDHRAKVVEALQAKGISTRPIGGGNFARQPWWKAVYGNQKRERPNADRIHDCGFALPNHPGLEAEDVHFITETVLAVKP